MSTPPNDANHHDTLDRDLHRFSHLETATQYVARPMIAPGIALVFMVLAGLGAAMVFGGSQANLGLWGLHGDQYRRQ